MTYMQDEFVPNNVVLDKFLYNFLIYSLMKFTLSKTSSRGEISLRISLNVRFIQHLEG